MRDMGEAAIRVRPARAEECDGLSRLALRAKAVWGYDAAFLAAAASELAVTPQRMARETVLLAEADGRTVGLGALAAGDAAAEVTLLFVAPEVQRGGVGRRLLAALLTLAWQAGCRRVFVDADPNARAFYERQGFRLIGDTPSESIPGRRLPRLMLSLADRH